MQTYDPSLQPVQPVPPGAGQPGAVPQQPAPAVSQTPYQADGGDKAVIEQAQRLISQLRTNPYQLSGAFQQLKTQYVAQKFNVKPTQDKQ